MRRPSREAIRSLPHVVIEPIESRLLQSVSTWSATTISDYSGDNFVEVLFGDNGDPYGVPTAAAGSFQASSWGYTQWDTNLDDGLDSGWRTVSLAINASGTETGTWSVASETGSLPISSSNAIHQVIIRADISGGQMEVDWRSLTVNFYRHGQLIENVSAGSVSAGSLTATDSDPRESGVVIVPSASDCDGVEVLGEVRLQAAQGVYPGATDLFGQIAIS